MKRWMASLAIVSLVAVSAFVIYKEAFAIPQLCDTMEQMCTYCRGSWDLYWCEPYDMNGNGLIDCQFCCYNSQDGGWPCEWPYGDICGQCVL